MDEPLAKLDSILPIVSKILYVPIKLPRPLSKPPNPFASAATRPNSKGEFHAASLLFGQSGKNIMPLLLRLGGVKDGNSMLIVIGLIGVLLAVIALLVWWRRREGKLEGIRKMYKNKVSFAQWIIGIVLALIAAYFMFDGDILGENTTGISIVIGIVGIGLIATSNVTYYLSKRNKAD